MPQDIKDLGKLGFVVEQAFSFLHRFTRLAICGERLDLRDAPVSLDCGLICWRRLKDHTS
ncbi:hypothetical protein [Streptomyces sp. UNOC14_S4]|uniref:hypothetical protein n=1 Tax=Streptomyces sp. UNOC14_S4 TaxID=2872340 RepID=UPI001E36ED34|nr:hypothetical protein [Streptomyces sp. UNOC14_S4]MCC3767755.1 hypothetical protein [Streptomyces sp. UNOC14_S4]